MINPSIALTKEQIELLEILQSWRACKADEKGIPRYCIFKDAELTEIAVQQPTTLKELAQIKGIGKFKLVEHCDDLFLIISTHRQKHN